MDSQILSLYAKGMTTREIVETFKEMCDADVSTALISKVTDTVKEQVAEWQNRQPDTLYPIVYIGFILVKVRRNDSVINKVVFLAPGINTEGRKECKHTCFSSTHFLRFPVFQPSAGTLPASGYSGIHEAARSYIPSASAR